MRPDFITVYLKEMREVLRDRKTLIFMVLLPTLVVPLLMNLLIGFAMRAEKKAAEETLGYSVFGAEHLPELAESFEKGQGFRKVEIETIEQVAPAIAEGKIKFALVIPEGSAAQIEAGEQVAVELYYDNASVTSKVRMRAGRVIADFGKQLQSRRLSSLGVEGAEKQERWLWPVTIEEHGTADMRESIGERVGGMLPYLFIIFCFMGSLYPAIDIGAGEKERGTLETLLLAPVRRREIVLGKFLVIFTTGVTAALLCITSIGVTLASKVKEVTGVLGEVIGSVSVVDLALIAAMLIPTAAMFAALLLSVSIYARSFKEASSYCGPLNMVVIVPAIIAMLPGVELNWRWAMVPITNISLAIKELVKGTMDYAMLIVILGSSIVIAGGLLVFCTKWFEREAVIFRE
jgi:sodium transport system permease protein